MKLFALKWPKIPERDQASVLISDTSGQATIRVLDKYLNPPEEGAIDKYWH